MINLCKFPQRHKFSKLFNRNTIKVSYSCIPNTQTKAEIHKYSKNALEEAQQLNKNIQIPSSAIVQIKSSVL